MYPRNAASPEPIAIGAVVQISDGVVQTSGCTVRIKPIGVAEGDGAGTTAYSTDGIVLYTPTQGETNYTSFVLIAKKTGCIPVSITVVTSASSTPGTVEHAGTIKTLDALDTAQDSQHGTTQTAIADVPTNAEFEARTLVAANYFDPAADAVANVTTVATTTNLTNLPAITTNWLTADGLATDAVAEIQNGLATAANLATVAGYLDTEIAAILADTNELQSDWVNGGRLDLILDARASQTSVDAIDGIVDAILLDTGTDGVVVATNNDKTGYFLSGTQVFNNTGNFIGNLSGGVGSVIGSVGSVLGGINTSAGTITTLDGLDTAQDTQHAITQAAVSAIGITGGIGLNYPAEADNVSSPIKSISLVGTETSGTYASTESDDGTYHQITGSATALDIVYQVDVTAIRKCVAVQWRGYVSGLNDTITVQAYDFVGADWETRTTISGQAGTNNVTVNIPMLSKHTGTGTDIGLVLVRFVCTGQTNPILNTDLLLAEGAIAGQTVGYADGAVWIDTVNGTAGTASFVNGVADNTVLTLADALTIATTLGVANFRVINGSTITLTTTTANKVFQGHEWTLALGGQNIASSAFFDAGVSGTATGDAAEFQDCQIGNVTMAPSQYYSCTFTGTFTVGSAGDFLFMDCASQVAGSGAPVFDYAAIGATTVSFRRWSGGLTVNNMATGDVMSVDVVSGGTITINGTGGTASIRGMCNVVDGSGGAVTITETSVLNQTVLATPTNVSDAQTAIIAQVDANETKIDTLTTNLAIVDTVVDGIQTDLSNATDGLGALKALIDALPSRSSITGGNYALDTDANGRVRVVDGTGTGELDTLSGTVLLRSATQASIDAIEADTNELQTNQGNWLTATGFSTHSASDIWTNPVRGLTTADKITSDSYPIDMSSSGVISTVNLVNTVTTNSDMRGTDNAVLAASLISVSGIINNILADTNELQTNQGNWSTATGFSTHSASDVWSSTTRGLTTAANITSDTYPIGMSSSGVVGAVNLVNTTVTNTDMRGTDNSYTGTPPTASGIADVVWQEQIGDHNSIAGSTAEQLSAAGSAGDPWSTALPGGYTSGQAGKILGDNLNTTVSSRTSQVDIWSVSGVIDNILTDTNELQTDWVDGGRLDNILDSVSSNQDILSISGLLENIPTNSEFYARTIPSGDYFNPTYDVVAHVTLVDTTVTNSDMRGTDNAALEVSLISISGVVNEVLTDTNDLQTNQNNWLTAAGFSTISDIYSVSGLINQILIDTDELEQDWSDGGRLDLILDSGSTLSASDVWSYTIRGLTTATNITSDTYPINMSSSGVIGTVNLVNTTTTNTDMRGTDNASLETSLISISGVINTILSDTNELQTNQNQWLTASGFSTYEDIISISGIMNDILIDTNELQTDDYPGRFNTIDTTLLQMSGTVNNIYTDLTDGGRLDLIFDDINSKVDVIDSVVDTILVFINSSGVTISSDTANDIADSLLKRDWNSISGESARSVLNALRILRNKVSEFGGTLTVTKEDDSTTAWVASVTTDVSANPIITIDPS